MLAPTPSPTPFPYPTLFRSSGDRGVPVRGDKGASVHVRSVVEALGALGVEARILTTRAGPAEGPVVAAAVDRKSTRLNSSHVKTSYAVFCLKKKKLSQHYR